LHAIDCLDIVNFLSWRYHDPAKQLSDRLGIAPKHATYGPVGGESPIRYLHEAAQRIARGESDVRRGLRRRGAVLRDQGTACRRRTAMDAVLRMTCRSRNGGAAFQKPMATKLGVISPITVYPFYEAALGGALGPEARARPSGKSGDLWSRYSTIAAQNPNALAESAALRPMRSQHPRRTTG